MTDPAFTLLAEALNRDNSPNLLWVVDENLSEADLQQIQSRPLVQTLTNRIDIDMLLQHRGFISHLSDFSLEIFSEPYFDAIYFRVSKEKAIVHHVINVAARYLKPGGVLVLAGCKNEGIKTYLQKAAQYFGGEVETRRGDKTALLARIARAEQLGDSLDDKNYVQPVEVIGQSLSGEEIVFTTKPGLYGWNKIDKGSALLASLIPDVLERLAVKPPRIIDLGCGFGYLSVMASQLLTAEFVATDNNVAAVEMCRENFSSHRISGEVVLADCGEGIGRGFDLVLCNPPFHQGFSVQGDLTEKFLAAAKRLLKTGGCALFVVNSFIPLERKAQTQFSSVETLANNGSFKVLLLKA